MSQSTPHLPSIDEVSRLQQHEFAEAIKPLFEAAPPLARGLWERRPFSSYEQLLDTAREVIDRLSADEQVEVINAHPRIGAAAAAVRQRSLLSYAEQGYDAEAALPAEERERIYRELAALNDAYEQRFGFNFVVFVNGRPKAAIIDVLRQRLENPADQERATALAEMLAIAADRLRKLR